jgi:antitoxin component YwqK of YwqJK toxin-antitoxin module
LELNWFEPEIVINDLDDSKMTVLYDDGSLHYEVELKNGMKHGNFREYFPEGTLKVRGKFKDDKPEGSWKLYDEEDKIIEEKEFNNGIEGTN